MYVFLIDFSSLKDKIKIIMFKIRLKTNINNSVLGATIVVTAKFSKYKIPINKKIFETNKNIKLLSKNADL